MIPIFPTWNILKEEKEKKKKSQGQNAGINIFLPIFDQASKIKITLRGHTESTKFKASPTFELLARCPLSRPNKQLSSSFSRLTLFFAPAPIFCRGREEMWRWWNAMKNDNGRLLESRTITDKTEPCQRSLASLHKPGNRPGQARPGQARQAGRSRFWFNDFLRCTPSTRPPRIVTDTYWDAARKSPRSSRESSRHLVQTYSSRVYVRAGSKILSSRDSETPPLSTPRSISNHFFFPGSIRFLDNAKIFFLLLFLFFNAVFFEYLSQLIQTLKSARVSLIKSFDG